MTEALTSRATLTPFSFLKLLAALLFFLGLDNRQGKWQAQRAGVCVHPVFSGLHIDSAILFRRGPSGQPLFLINLNKEYRQI